MAIIDGYCTLTQLKARLDVPDAFEDATLDAAIEAASRAVDGMTGRGFGQTTETRAYTADWPDRIETGDLVSVTTLTVDGTVWDASAYELDGFGATATRIVATGASRFPVGQRKAVSVAGVFGWPAVPVAIREAALLLAARYFKRKDSPLGIQVGKQEFGNLSIPGRDPDVERLIQPYRVYAVVGA